LFETIDSNSKALIKLKNYLIIVSCFVSCQCHCVYFILRCTKIIIFTTRKLFKSLNLIKRVVLFIYVSYTDISPTTISHVWWISNTKISSTTKSWTVRLIIPNGILFVGVFKCVHIGQWKQKGATIAITNPIASSRLPFAFCVSANNLIMIGLN
jgi:hypothetical protein